MGAWGAEGAVGVCRGPKESPPSPLVSGFLRKALGGSEAQARDNIGLSHRSLPFTLKPLSPKPQNPKTLNPKPLDSTP